MGWRRRSNDFHKFIVRVNCLSRVSLTLLGKSSWNILDIQSKNHSEKETMNLKKK